MFCSVMRDSTKCNTTLHCTVDCTSNANAMLGSKEGIVSPRLILEFLTSSRTFKVIVEIKYFSSGLI